MDLGVLLHMFLGRRMRNTVFAALISLVTCIPEMFAQPSMKMRERSIAISNASFEIESAICERFIAGWFVMSGGDKAVAVVTAPDAKHGKKFLRLSGKGKILVQSTPIRAPNRTLFRFKAWERDTLNTGEIRFGVGVFNLRGEDLGLIRELSYRTGSVNWPDGWREIFISGNIPDDASALYVRFTADIAEKGSVDIDLVEDVSAHRSRSGLWAFPNNDFSGWFRLWLMPGQYERSQLEAALRKDMELYRLLGVEILTIRIPLETLPWQQPLALSPLKNNGLPPVQQIRALYDFVEFAYSQGFLLTISFDFNADPYWLNNQLVLSDLNIPLESLELVIDGFYDADDRQLYIKNKDEIYRITWQQVLRNNRTGELILVNGVGGLAEGERAYINVPDQEEVGWRNSYRTGGRGFGTPRYTLCDGDILEAIGNNDWIATYLESVLCSRAMYGNTFDYNLTNHPGILAWYLMGEARFSGQRYGNYPAHDTFFKKFWPTFFDLVHAGSAGQYATFYTIVDSIYDDWSLENLENVKRFFSEYFPHRMPLIWGIELYGREPSQAYAHAKSAIEHLSLSGDFYISPFDMFNGEWAFDTAGYEQNIGTPVSEMPPVFVEEQQVLVVDGILQAMQDFGIRWGSHWRLWADNASGKHENVLAYPLKSTLLVSNDVFLNGMDITGSSIFTLRQAAYTMQRFSKAGFASRRRPSRGDR